MNLIWIWQACVLVIICIAHGHSVKIALNSTNEVESNWNDFQNRHVVDSDQGSVENWKNLLRSRLHGQYGKKGVNSFIVNTATIIGENFPSSVPQYTGGSSPDLFWSSTTQHIFVMTLASPPGSNNPNYNVYDCGQKFYVAGLDMKTRLPVHFQGQSSTQGPKLDKPIAGCKRVNSKTPMVQLVN